MATCSHSDKAGSDIRSAPPKPLHEAHTFLGARARPAGKGPQMPLPHDRQYSIEARPHEEPSPTYEGVTARSLDLQFPRHSTSHAHLKIIID